MALLIYIKTSNMLVNTTVRHNKYFIIFITEITFSGQVKIPCKDVNYILSL